MRFAPLYEVPVLEADAEVRAAIDVADKLGLEGPGAAFRWVKVALRLETTAPDERVRRLIAHARRGCHTEHSLTEPVPVDVEALVNGQPLAQE